jgi:DNA polymerase III sliding clamp (beta) subunit (PCNA family)
METMLSIPSVLIEINVHGIQLIGSNADISIENFLSFKDKKVEIQFVKYGSIILKEKFFQILLVNCYKNYSKWKLWKTNK